MNQEINENFKNELLKLILKRIHREEQKRTRRRSICSITILILSIVYLIIIWPFIYNDFIQSGFFYLFSLILSHSEIIFAYFKDSMILILESLPIFGLLLLLSGLIFLVSSIRYLLKNYRYSHLDFSFGRK